MTGDLDDDPPEAAELERSAEWRLRKVDADPSDQRSAAAAQQLRKLAGELRLLAVTSARRFALKPGTPGVGGWGK